MFWEQQIQHAIASDVGLRRQNNEDAVAAHLCSEHEDWLRRGHVFIVADGMGGHAVGELASSMAVGSVPHSFLKSREGDPLTALRRAVEAANQAIHSRGTQNRDFLNMGTTCTALVLSQWGATIAHVGDSRAYRIRRDRIDQLTFDHSLSWELMRQRPKLAQKMNLDQHRNVITRSLGPEENVQVDVEGPHPVAPGDTFLLCSDGLSNLVKDEEICSIVRELPPKQSARLLVHLANSRGGPDNITVAVARVGDLPANVAPEPVIDVSPIDNSHDWPWLIGFWIGMGLLVVGLAAMLGGRQVQGGIITGIAVAVVMSMLTMVARNRVRQPENSEEHPSQTNVSRVYRTAVGLSSQALFKLLADVCSDLERTAREDSWRVSWKDFDSSRQLANTDANANRFSKAVRHVGRCIDLLMTARTGLSVVATGGNSVVKASSDVAASS